MIDRGGAVTWLRTVDGTRLKLLDEYNPSFYVLPKAGLEGPPLRRLGISIVVP
jgi:hypothetical protein